MNRRDFIGIAAALGPRRLSAVPAGKLRAGAATANITPALDCSLSGQMVDRRGVEVHDELHVRAVALDNGQTRMALAVIDSCAVPRSILDLAKEMIREQTGVPAAHLLLSASHTHSGPAADHLFQSEPDPKYTDWLAVRIADCIRLAFGRLQPARIGWATGREERLVFNRRYYMKPGTIPPNPLGQIDRVLMNPPAGSPDIVKPAGPTDPDVGVVAVESLDGRPIALLGNYALHYVGGTGPGHISADYFGAWANSIARLAGANTPFVALLSNACSGNINGIDFRLTRAQPRSYELIERYADILAAECYRTWRTIVFQDSVELAGSIEELAFGVRLPGEAGLSAARKVLDAAGPPPPLGYADRRQIYAREAVLLSQNFPATVKTPVQALRIGALGIATFPGEAFVELGLEVKSKSPLKPTLLIELANDYRGYIPTIEAHELGGYETWRAKSSYLEKEAAPKMIASVLNQLEKL